MITRRKMIATAAGAALAGATRKIFGQGISSRGVRAQPRGKPSGRPFLCRLTDVAMEAGLTHPITYGGLDTKKYIIEVVGCGVAFIDYDNDGWMDIFLLLRNSLRRHPTRDDEPPIQEQSGWHVYGRDGESGSQDGGLGIRRLHRRLR